MVQQGGSYTQLDLPDRSPWSYRSRLEVHSKGYQPTCPIHSPGRVSSHTTYSRHYPQNMLCNLMRCEDRKPAHPFGIRTYDSSQNEQSILGPQNDRPSFRRHNSRILRYTRPGRCVANRSGYPDTLHGVVADCCSASFHQTRSTHIDVVDQQAPSLDRSSYTMGETHRALPAHYTR